MLETPPNKKSARRGRLGWGLLRRAFRRNQDGATMIEFGILAFPFFAIVVAIIETSIVFLSSSILDSAVDQSTRIIRTGQAQSNSITADDYRGVICDKLLGLFDCSALVISVKTSSDFRTAKATFPIDLTDGTWKITPSYAPGGRNDIVLVEVYYKWPTIIDFYNFNLANSGDGNRLMSAVRVFKNEPF